MTNSNFSDSQLQQAYQKAFKAYIRRNNVTGIDIGYKYVGGQRTDDIVVRIHVQEKIPEIALEAAQVFPRDIDGVPVDIIQAIYKSAAARKTLFQRQIRQSVIQPGLSISHPNVSAGTLGTVVYDNLTGRPCILSNWHVLVGSNNASPGDDIIQPGFDDGGRLPRDRVGQLERSILNEEGDAAIAFFDLPADRSLDLTQFETGVVVQSARQAKIGDIVEKSGRTTGVTQGKVDGFGAYTIPYSVGARTIQGFKIVSEIDGNPNNDEISSGGDSGSIWYDRDSKQGLGLHFAGETDPNPRQEQAIACHLPIVLDALNISLMPLAKKGIPLQSTEAAVGSLQEVIDNNLFIPYGDIETSPLAENAQLCEEIQEILANNNFYRYRIDGIYGRRTRQALRDFKTANSVGGGDVLGPTTAEILLRFANGGGNPGRCPFAVWKPITGSSGSYLGGPFKIVHHTTEGSTAAGAMAAYRSNRSDPHFTVDDTTIYQHINTNNAARSLRNPPGGVQTNRDSAIQIEVVAFAGRSKDRGTLENVARLCRWIERTYDIPQVWPNGFPRPARDGRDPGGHNRNARNWDDESGHYGHCHVPENTHWDPAYTISELEIVMGGVLRTLETAEAAEGELLSVPEIEVELDNLKLITYPVTVNLDANGQGDVVLDVAWERVIAVIPQAVKNAQGVWETCTASLAEVNGQTLLVATSGYPEAVVTVLVKVIDPQMLSPESVGCPIGDEMEQLNITSSDLSNQILPQDSEKSSLLSYESSRSLVLTRPGTPINSLNNPEQKLIQRFGTSQVLINGVSNLKGFVPSYASPKSSQQPTTDEDESISKDIIPEDIIGNDDRDPITNPFSLPWQMICSLEIKTNHGDGIGTGCIVGQRTILTAAHNLYDVVPSSQQIRKTSQVSIYPGRSGDRTKNGLIDTVNQNGFYIPQNWLNNQDPNFDYALIFLNRNIGSHTGTFGLTVFSDQRLTGLTASLAGYPVEFLGQTLMFDANKIQSVQRGRLVHLIDTENGQSGSPLWVQDSINGRLIIGIHTDGHGTTNSATRITNAVFNDIDSKII